MTVVMTPPKATTHALAYDVDLIDVADHNRRKHKPSAEADKELQQSLRTLGQLQPGIGRWVKGGRIELLAGARRFKALKAIDAKEMRLELIECTDEEARAITLTENLQREDVHPLDQAEYIVQMLSMPNISVDGVAARIGMTRQAMMRRAQIAKMTKKWKKAIEDADHVASLLSAAHLEEVARLPASAQDEALEILSLNYSGREYGSDNERLNGLSIATLRKMIHAGLGNLAQVPWSLDDAGLVPKAGACNNCPKRAHAEMDLWQDLQPGAGACQDGDCFNRKMHAQLEVNAKKIQAETGKAPFFIAKNSYETVLDRRNEDDAELLAETAYRDNFKTVSAKTEGAMPAISIDPATAGQVVWVKPKEEIKPRDLPKEARPEKKPDSEKTPAEKKATLKERRTVLEARRGKWVIEAAAEWLTKNVCDATHRKIRRDVYKEHYNQEFCAIDVAAAAFGLPFKNDRPDDAWGRLENGKVLSEYLDILASGIGLIIHDRLRCCFDLSRVPECMKEAEGAAKMFHLLPLEELRKNAELEIPEPKSWAKLDPSAGEGQPLPKSKGAKRSAPTKQKRSRPSSKPSQNGATQRLKSSARRGRRTRRNASGKA